MSEQHNEGSITFRVTLTCLHCGEEVKNVIVKIQGKKWHYTGVCANPKCERSLGGSGTLELLQLVSGEDRVRILKDLGFVKDEDGNWFQPGEDPLD